MTAISFDTETWLIRPGRLAPPLVCISTTFREGQQLVSRLATRTEPELRGLFEEVLEKDPIYGVNVAYDMGVCLREWPDLFRKVFKAYDEDRVVDVSLNQQLADIAKGRANGRYGLAALEKRWLRQDRSDEKKGPDVWRLRYRELHNVPLELWPKEAIEYSLADASGTFRVGEAQWADGGTRKYLKNAPAQARAAFGLHLMMCWGVKTDPERIEALRKAAQEIYEKLDASLRELGLVKSDGTRNVAAAQRRMVDVCKAASISPKLTKEGYKRFRIRLGEWKDAIKEGREFHPEDVFSEGELIKYVSVDEDACEESGDSVLVDYSKRTQLHNILNTHVPDLLRGVDEPIQPRYITMVASGRTACAKSRAEDGKSKSPTNGFQFQNPKRSLDYLPAGIGIRECFIARPGKLFADNDFGGLELCTGAQGCIKIVGYSMLGEALNAGRDPHLQFGGKLMGISYEEALSRKHEKEVKYHRQLAKVANFGFPGGLGVRGLVGYARGYELKLTPEDCKKLRDDWFKEFPEWRDYFKWVRSHINQVVVKDGEDEMILERGEIEQLYVNRIRGGVSFTAACNTIFQGLGADGAKSALYEVQKRCYVRELGSVLYGARPVGFIHDEILAEVFEELAHEQAFEMAKVMVDACNVFLPDVPVKCVPALSKRWSKEAEAVFDKAGRLQPYDLAKEGRWDVYYDPNAEVKVKWT